MKRTIYTLLFSIIVIIPVLLGMASPMKMTDAREKKGVIQIETEPNLEIHEGYVSQKEETILVKKGKKTVAKVHLSEPVMVAMADKEEMWGYFQFPGIAIAEDGALVVNWQMNKDSHEAYGKKSGREQVPMMSRDKGMTWVEWDMKSFALGGNYYVRQKNGNILEIYTPKAKDIREYIDFPDPIGEDGEKSYYSLESLPKDLQNIYFNLWYADRRSKFIISSLYDPGLLRYALGNLMPIVWWENIKEMDDNTLIAGVYPCYYKNKGKGTIYETVSFYQSSDEGKSWKIVGKIPFDVEKSLDRNGVKSFDEPVFEVLKDSSLLCVMRTGSSAPMYKSFSKDFGKSWSQPVAFTPNGVKPSLKRLKNGVLVLASGRPGIQVRFSLDGLGDEWTAPIDMIPFMNSNGTYNRDVSCGYASIWESGENSIYLVYSDFTTSKKEGMTRKSIWFRKVEVNKK